jgi:hypothetical protein
MAAPRTPLAPGLPPCLPTLPCLSAVRAYSRPIWLLPRAVSPALPVFLLVSVYWGLGDELDVLHVTSIAGKGGGGVGGAGLAARGAVGTGVHV